MQNRKRRYWGMTGTQLIVLGCLGAMAIGMMGFTGWFILGSSQSQNVPQAQPDQNSLQTFVPLPTLTFRPTQTPILPTFTFTPTTYESFIPDGWNQIKYDKVELWIPPNFVKNPSGKALISMIDGQSTNSDFKNTISLMRDDGITSDLEKYVLDQLGHLSTQYTYLGRQDFQIGSYEAMRLKVQVVILGVSIGEAMYLVKNGSTVWSITCASYYNEFNNLLPTFDQVAHTFRINN